MHRPGAPAPSVLNSTVTAAVNAMANALRAAVVGGAVVDIVALGPLTNVACLVCHLRHHRQSKPGAVRADPTFWSLTDQRIPCCQVKWHPELLPYLGRVIFVAGRRAFAPMQVGRCGRMARHFYVFPCFLPHLVLARRLHR